MQWIRTAIVAVLWAGGLLVLSALLAWNAVGQTAVTPQTNLTGELQSLAGRAGVIFAGQVISIERRGGVVTVTFRVEQALAGEVGSTYTLREWAGLWPPGKFRYTVGQRALVFLNAANAAGLASPVDGPEGVVPVVVQGADEPELLDIRRLDATLLRPVGTPLPQGEQAAIQLSDALNLIAAVRLPGVHRFHSPLRTALPGRGTVPFAPGGGLEPSGVLDTGAGGVPGTVRLQSLPAPGVEESGRRVDAIR